MPNERQAVNSRVIVNALVPTCARRRRNKPYLLIISNRLHFAPGGLGDAANCQIAGQ